MLATNALASRNAAAPRMAPRRAAAGVTRAFRRTPVQQAGSSSGPRRARRAAANAESSGAGASVATASVDVQGGLAELTKDTFHEYLAAAGPDKLVVVDYYTDWCGPCKLIYPELVKLSAELEPACTVVKFNCNQYNKDLAKTLGIKVAPTFHVFRGGSKVAEMTGAKVDKLRELIDEHMKAGGTSN